MKYNKLVRDRIPEIIKSKGDIPIAHIADDKEYWQKLKEKLQEEVNEFMQDENAEEMADILEVIDAITNFKNFSKEELEIIKNKKAEERGKFKDKIILEES
ncbi:MAG: nucleoside triphosphate pyrophosphohydrolase [Candidatus Paceibacterota bacterium]|jgi:predicted house-cleaning noncanonical NTP pyrophosphatase (MazG superfamily)